MCLGLPHVTGRIGHCEIFHIKVVSLTLHGGNVTEVLVWTVLATVSVVGHHHSVNALAQQADGIVQDYATLKTSNIHYSGVFYNESVAMENMGSWFIATLIAQTAAGANDAENWGIVKYPHAEGIEPGTTLGTITALAIPASTKQQAAAWDFVKFVCGEEGAEVLAGTGNFPALTNDAINDIIASTPGFPQDEQSKEALNVAQLYLEMPLHDKSAEIEVVLNEFHDQIMTGNIGVDEGLAEMGARVDEVLAN